MSETALGFRLLVVAWALILSFLMPSAFFHVRQIANHESTLGFLDGCVVGVLLLLLMLLWVVSVLATIVMACELIGPLVGWK